MKFSNYNNKALKKFQNYFIPNLKEEFGKLKIRSKIDDIYIFIIFKFYMN